MENIRDFKNNENQAFRFQNGTPKTLINYKNLNGKHYGFHKQKYCLHIFRQNSHLIEITMENNMELKTKKT